MAGRVGRWASRLRVSIEDVASIHPPDDKVRSAERLRSTHEVRNGVISRPRYERTQCPLCPSEPDLNGCYPEVDARHVWTAPGWQGQSSRRRAWSVQPCVRPSR